MLACRILNNLIPSRNVLTRTQCPKAKYTPIHERSYSFSKKEKSMQSPRRYTCLGHDPKYSPRPKSTCYKFCNKDKCPRALGELQKTYYDHCQRDNCPVHINKEETAENEKCPDETGLCRKVIPILKKASTKSDDCKISINTFGEYKYCSCGKPGIYCVCVQNKAQPPPANSKFVATYTHTFTTVKEKATSCSDIQRKKLNDAMKNFPCLPCAPSVHNLASQKRSSKSEDVKMLMKSPRDMVSSSSGSVDEGKNGKPMRENSPCEGRCCNERCKARSRSSSDGNM